MEQQFAHEYKLVLERSRDEAIRHHCNKIEPIHIFLALTHDSNSKPYKLIEALGNVPIDQLRSDIDTIAHSLSDNEIATTSIVASPLSERIIKLSALEARMLKSDVVNTEHLLLALFHNSEIQNMDFFKRMIDIGISYDNIYMQLKNNNNQPTMGTSFSEDDIDDDDIMSQSDKNKSDHNKSNNQSTKKSQETPVLDKYGIDMTKAAEDGQLDPVIGREVEIERIAEKMCREIESEDRPCRSFILNAYMRLIFAKLIRALLEDVGDDRPNLLTDEVLRYIDANFTSPVTATSLAEHCFYNPAYLGRVFKTVYGKGLKEYLREKRLSLAMELLESTSLSVDEICARVGYASKALFYKNFKELYGKAPGEFRKDNN